MIVSCRRSPSGCAVTEDEIFGLWSLVFKGLWSLVFGLWSLVFGLWSLAQNRVVS